MMTEFKIKLKSRWWRLIWLPSSWLAEEVVRLNCCSRYFPRKAAKPATTAISMQAASVMQLNTGLERRCLVTRGITALQKTEKKCKRLQDRRSNTFTALKKWYDVRYFLVLSLVKPHLWDAHKPRAHCSYRSHEWTLWVLSPGTPGWEKKAAWPARSPRHHPGAVHPMPEGSQTWRGPTGRVRHHRGGSPPTTPQSSEDHLGWCPVDLEFTREDTCQSGFR